MCNGQEYGREHAFCASLHDARPELVTTAASTCRGDVKVEVEAVWSKGRKRMEVEQRRRSDSAIGGSDRGSKVELMA